MSRPGYADRERLKSWANTRQAQSELPRLVRRLILETSSGVVRLGMPADEGVAGGDWDGSVRTEAGTAFVPGGLSVWELSVDKSPGTKADSDYSKRNQTPDGTATADTTYVEAILRPWTGRDTWARERTAEAKWKQVRAYGLDDIATWLESAPVTWAWVSEELGLEPYGLQTAETFWRGWSAQTAPPLEPELILAGRDSNGRQLSEALARPGITTLTEPSLDEISAFLAAHAVAAERRGEGQVMARMVFVDELITWRRLAESTQPLVLIPRDPEFAKELPQGSPHTVLVPVRGDDGDIKLDPLASGAVAECFKAAGVDEEEARELGQLARRSLTALRRSVATKASLHRPPWAESVDRAVRAMLLVGRWEDLADADKNVLAELAGIGYDAVRERAMQLAREGDPFVALTGSTWHLVSPVDAWLLLRPSVNTEDLTRLKDVVEKVLGEDDPALDVAPDDRWWKASVEGKRRVHSGSLRQGLAEGLALLGAYGNRVTTSGGSSGADWAEYAVRDLLKPANDDASGRRWIVLADHLPLLAEAAPEAVLEALSVAMRGDTPTARQFFADHDDGFFSPSSPHTEVLWALETIAWSTDYFGRAVDLLARFAEIDPGGRTSNRPAASLAATFRPGQPATGAPMESRLAVFDALRKRHSAVAWSLALAMLPQSRGVHFPTRVPRYRDWKPATLRVTRGEYMEFVAAVVERCVADAGLDPSRWVQLIQAYSDLSPDDQGAILSGLEAQIDSGSFDESGKKLLWDELRDLVGKHREFHDARWALPEDELVKLDAFINRLTPQGARANHEWLFQSWDPHIGDARRRDDFEAYDAAVAAAREEAIAAIVDEGGLDEVIELASVVEVSHAVGWALAGARPDFDETLLPRLEFNSAKELELATQYYARRFRDAGWDWLDELRTGHALSAAQLGRLLLATRDFPRAWEIATDGSVETFFWENFSPLGLGADFAHVEFVAGRLIGVGRNAGALHLLNLYLRRGKSEDSLASLELVMDALANLLAHQDDPEMGALRSYDFEALFERLEQRRDEIDLSRLAQLEWGYLRALDHDAKPQTLMQELATNPEFFVEMVCTVYRAHTGDDEEGDDNQTDSEARQALAGNAYGLLSAWNLPPGLKDGALDAEELKQWLLTVLPLLDERDRAVVGRHHIGQVLVATPPDADRVWPGEVVRDLFEDLQDDEIERGFSLQVFNGRGVTTRGLEDGGVQEVGLAKQYRDQAARVADTAPRTAALLRKIATSYEADARREDEDAERFRRGLH